MAKMKIESIVNRVENHPDFNFLKILFEKVSLAKIEDFLKNQYIDNERRLCFPILFDYRRFKHPKSSIINEKAFYSYLEELKNRKFLNQNEKDFLEFGQNYVFQKRYSRIIKHPQRKEIERMLKETKSVVEVQKFLFSFKEKDKKRTKFFLLTDMIIKRYAEEVLEISFEKIEKTKKGKPILTKICTDCNNPFKTTVEETIRCRECDAIFVRSEIAKPKTKRICLNSTCKCEFEIQGERSSRSRYCPKCEEERKNSPEIQHKIKKRKEIDQRRGRKVRFEYAVQQASLRGKQWELTKEEFEEISNQPCIYCGKESCGTGVGLDRIDNEKGYLKENVVSSCADCNIVRGARLTYEEMKIAMKAVCEYRREVSR